MGLYIMPHPVIGNGFDEGKPLVVANIFDDSWESIVTFALQNGAVMSDDEGEFFYLVYEFGLWISTPVPFRKNINQELRSIACGR